MAKARDASIDLSRAIAMIFVLIGHTSEIFFAYDAHGFNESAFATYKLIYNFHMPAFYFISGMAMNGIQAKNARHIISNSLSLFIFCISFHFISYCALSYFSIAKGSVLNELVKPIVLGTAFPLAILWFPVSLAAVQLLCWMIYRGGALKWLSICALALSLALSLISSLRIFQMQSWAVGSLFFILGNYCFHSLAKLRSKAATYGLLFLSSLLVPITYNLNKGCRFNPLKQCDGMFGHDFVMQLAGSHLGFLPWLVIAALPGVMAIVLLSRTYSGGLLARPLIWIGRNTLALFVVNGFVLSFQGSFYSHVQQAPLPWYLSCGALVLSQILVSYLINPLVTWVYAQSSAIASQLASLLLRHVPARIEAFAKA